MKELWRAAEKPAARAQTMMFHLLGVRDAIYAGDLREAEEGLRGFRAHLAFLDFELACLEAKLQAALEVQDAE